MTKLEARNRRYYIKKAIRYLKSKSGCVLCGYKIRTDKLCFHHKLNSSKLFNVSDIPKDILSWKLVSDEIKKCVILCIHCHGRTHYKTVTGAFNVN